MTITQIVNKVYFLTGTDSNSFSAANMLLAINNAYERVVSLIMQSDGRWEWDDTNNTDLPIATATITASQKDYGLATTHLNILRVQLKDTAGLWSQLRSLNEGDLKGLALDEFMRDSAVPIYYDLVGSSLFLYPTPNFTQAASLKVYFQRPPSLYTSGEVTTGTKEPGFFSLFHDLIPLWVSYDFALAKGKANARQLRAEIQVREQSLADHYLLRNKDDTPKIKMVYNSSR